jgi:hypothetical protein
MKQPDESDVGTCQATYCPEDNKLRLYSGRVARATYEWLRELGFASTPKQDCDFVATWTPQREDAALMLIAEDDDIGDEDQSPEDRAADRAERFAGYREKRRAEAGGLADRYDNGPEAYGNQNAARAERMAARRDRTGARACSQWSKAEYWQHRTAGVISHALHISSPAVRRGRILRLEAEQRKHAAGIEEAQTTFDGWQKVFGLPGADDAFRFDDAGRIIGAEASLALRAAYALANSASAGWWYKHPRTGNESSLYSHLTNTRDPITAREAATLAVGDRKRPEPGRWAAHYELRLAYERQMLEAEGGSAGNVEMEPGGMLGRYLILKVNKSAATGAVVSVNVYVPKKDGEGYDYRRRGETMLINIQRMGEHVYTPPTDESRARFAEIKKEQSAKAKEQNAGAPKLINPTPEDAERLQAELNRLAYEKRRTREKYTTREEMVPTPVAYMTQAEYSARSAGTYARYGTQPLLAGPALPEYFRRNLPAICKLRIGPRVEITQPTSTRGMAQIVGMSEAPAVVVITDKPQHPLPDWSKVEQEERATA